MGLSQIVFHCKEAHCVGGGVHGMEVTYVDKTVVSHGAVGGKTPKPDDNKAKLFVIDSDAGEYLRSMTVFWKKEHGIGLSLTTSDNRTTM